MRAIDSDKLKETINRNKYLLRNASNTHDYGMFTIGIYQAIDKEDELPTMQSGNICDYCTYHCDNEDECTGFVGKKVIEVSDEN